MAVGITILSGARQGERLEFDLPEFRAGGKAGCQVFFDPARDPGAQGREGWFRLDNDGWSLKNAGAGDLLVNGRAVQGSTRLRSGDVVRLSPGGPDFSFTLLPRLSSTSGIPLAAPIASTPTAAESGLQQGGDSRGTPLGEAPRGKAGRASPRGPTVRQFAILLVTSTAVALVLLAASRAWRDGRHVAEVRNRPDAREMLEALDTTSEQPDRRVEPETNGSTDGPKGTGVDAVDDDLAEKMPPTKAQDAWDIACEKLRATVFLLAVEKPNTQEQWPFATATAIGPDTLVTSATVAVESARFRQRGFRLWAMNQKTGGTIEVVDQRVHVGFERAAGHQELQIYADIGIVTLASKHPHVAALATEEDLDELDRGQPLACLGITHDGEQMNRFQSYPLEMTRGKVVAITELPPSPGGPRLLHVRMPLAAKVYGAPVVNEAGRLVGVFAESAQSPADQSTADLNLQYVPVIDLPLVVAWLDRRDEAFWVPPTVSPELERETKSPAP